MINFVVAFVIVMIEVLLIYLPCKYYSKVRKIDKKTVILSLLAIVYCPAVVYIFDLCDIPTKIGLLTSGQGDKWFDFATTFISSVIGALIGAVALVFVTMREFDHQREKDQEDRRVANMPYLKYEFDYNQEVEYAVTQTINIRFDNPVDKQTHESSRSILITNIGLNAIRKIFFLAADDNLKKYAPFYFYSQYCMDKGQTNRLILNFKNITDEYKPFKIIVYYQDLFKNWYSQIIDIKVKNIQIENRDIACLYIDPLEEEQVNGLPKELTDFIEKRKNSA